MTDLIFQSGLSNAFFAIAFAVAAMAVGKALNRPALTHLLWLLVFVRLIVPPSVHLSWGDPPSAETWAPIEAVTSSEPQDAAPLESAAMDWREKATIAVALAKSWLGPVWLSGALVGVLWTLVHVIRFNRLVASESRDAGPEVKSAAAKICEQLGLKESPRICVTKARLTPMVWWAGGSPRVILPTVMFGEMKPEEWECVLAHELAHVKRRDHVVRWLECLVCILFWWHPVVWWAQKNLRAAEEVCCDTLVLSRFDPKPSVYAESILAAVDSLALPALRPPAMASEINSGGTLEERIKMIISSKSEKRKRSIRPIVQVAALAAAVMCLPFGVALPDASAAEREVNYSAIGARLRAAINAGELNEEQAKAMMTALRSSRRSAFQEFVGRGKEAYRDRVRQEFDEKAHLDRVREEYDEKTYRDRVHKEQPGQVVRGPVYKGQPEQVYRDRVHKEQPEQVYRDRVRKEHPEQAYRDRIRTGPPGQVYRDRVRTGLPGQVYRDRVHKDHSEQIYRDSVRKESSEKARPDRVRETGDENPFQGRVRKESSEKARLDRARGDRDDYSLRDRVREERDEKARRDRVREDRDENPFGDYVRKERSEKTRLDRVREEALKKARLKRAQEESREKARRDSIKDETETKRDAEKQPKPQ